MRTPQPIARLLQTGWAVAVGREHHLSSVHGRQLGSATLFLLLGLHHSGPYPSYNWAGIRGPTGGHIMVEYDSAELEDQNLSSFTGQ